MKLEVLEELVLKGMSSRAISEQLGIGQTTVRYWLKKFDLKTRPSKGVKYKVNESRTKMCPRCSEEKDLSNFYKRRDGVRPSVYCKSCSSNQTVERTRAFKIKCLEFCGKSCVICGYNKCVSALEFHHLNISEKEFSIANLRKYSFSEVVKDELSKCITLCSNCHREVHSGLTPVPERPSKP